MNQAAVGFQCPSCVSEGAKTTRSGRTSYGGKASANPALTSQILIGINVAIWILIIATGGRRSRWFDQFALLTDGGVVESSNGSVILIPDGVNDGAYWQLLTSMFTHVELWHIGFNMLALWLFGPQLEQIFGRVRFLALYLLSGLTGSACVYWFTPAEVSQGFEFYIPTAGASGAIFGLFGAYLVVALKTRRNVTQMMVLLGINAFITFTVPNVSWQGHVGGLVGGALIGAILVYAPRKQRVTWQAAGLALVAVLLLVAFAARTLNLA